MALSRDARRKPIFASACFYHTRGEGRNRLSAIQLMTRASGLLRAAAASLLVRRFFVRAGVDLHSTKRTGLLWRLVGPAAAERHFGAADGHLIEGWFAGQAADGETSRPADAA
jgi:hypothetical protein